MSHPTRVVVDTSTLISAVLKDGSAPRRAFEEVQRGSTICTCPAALDELERVLLRPKFEAYLRLSERLKFFENYRAFATTWLLDAASEEAAHGVCRDPNDAMFLALSLVCRAQLLITSDADLLVLHGWRGVAIMSPADFLKALG